jgi:hypothetical protein
MTTKLDPRNLVLTAGVALLLAACSGAAAPASTSAPIGAAASAGGAAVAPVAATSDGAAAPSAAAGGAANACALLTKAEVEAAFGESMLEPVASVDKGDAACSWTHEAGGLDLTVKISARPSTAAAIKSLEGVYGDASADVPGVGDAAFEVAGILEFVNGTTLVIIGTGDGPAIISNADFQALTKLAAGRV